MLTTQFLSLALVLVAQGDEKSLADRLSFSADGRLRAESTFDQLNGEDRHRARMRIRINASYEIMEGLRAKARLTTRSDGNDANNVHWDFGDGGDGLAAGDVGFDRFYLEYDACDSVQLRAGKFPHVYTSPPVYGELVWDGDVQPTGVSAVWDITDGDGAQFDVRAAGYVVEENGADDDPSMLGVQGNFGTNLGESTSLHAASSLSFWGSIDDGTFGNQGNSATGGILDEKFTVWETYVSATHEGGPLNRQVAFVQHVNNIDDDSGEDSGIAAGIEIGERNPGDTSYFLVYYDLDANSVFSPVAQDDAPIAGTGTGMGITGFMGGLRHVVSKRFAVRVWGITSDADVAEDPWRARVDLDFNVR